LPISAKMPKSSLPLHRGPRNVQPGIAAQRSSTNFGTSPCQRRSRFNHASHSIRFAIRFAIRFVMRCGDARLLRAP
ncbi:hypothetical protein, partial [Aurantimonas sp. C2-4-R8]|uniref:hypothetical protein n=1 Tax=Aurantimonas sp. C2-4-R8 TaxID=3114364 RepID=UPI002E18D1E6|nr:hypothetical protein [Aurantimonas sp. C2-4-R8]